MLLAVPLKSMPMRTASSSARTGGSSPSIRAHSAAAIRSTTLGITCQCSPVKPGALRNGAPFKDWVLPAAMERVRRKLAGADDGNRQMVDILTAVLTDGLPAVETACAEAIAHGVHSADVVLNILARQRDPGPPATILTPAALTLRHAPVADCARYDNLEENHLMERTQLFDLMGRTQALRHEGCLRRDHGHCCQTPARASAHHRRSAQRRD